MENETEEKENALLVPPSEMAGLIKSLAREVQLDGAKGRIKYLLERRKRFAEGLAEIDRQRESLASKLARLDDNLQKLAANDVSVLDRSESYQCGNRKCGTTYNQLEFDECPECGQS
jgi:chromosome segregation ATPase